MVHSLEIIEAEFSPYDSAFLKLNICVISPIESFFEKFAMQYFCIEWKKKRKEKKKSFCLQNRIAYRDE